MIYRERRKSRYEVLRKFVIFPTRVYPLTSQEKVYAFLQWVWVARENMSSGLSIDRAFLTQAGAQVQIDEWIDLYQDNGYV